MTYTDAITFLESLIDYERTPADVAAHRVWNLDRIRHMLEAVGNPHVGLRCLHIAGTRGKGSTAVITASILTSAGYRVGLYTSPHLVCFRERIRIGTSLISEADVSSLVEEVRPVIESMRGSELGPPSFFEVYTLLALIHFARENVDFAVLEPGMGGRLDATNIVNPMACAITRIGLDHTQELGETLAQIAGEKAGIIKSGVPVVTIRQLDEAHRVIEQVCTEKGCALLVVGNEPGPSVSAVEMVDDRQVLSISQPDSTSLDVECPLLGMHQVENVALAVGLVELLSQQGIVVPITAIREGIRSVRWPGRFEVIRRNPYVVLDGAHDATGADALVAAVNAVLPGRRVILVFGMMRGHDAEAVASRLCSIADRVIVASCASSRAVDALELSQVSTRYSRSCTIRTPVAQALEEAISLAGGDDVVLVAGSLYVVGEAMMAL